MRKGQRIFIFLATMALLLVVCSIFRIELEALGNIGIVMLSALIMLSFTMQFAEHYFTRPTDVLASSIAILLLISPLHSDLQTLGIWYWAFWFYSALVLLVSLVALLLVDGNKSATSRQNLIAGVLKKVAVRFGGGKLLWFALFIMSLLFYVDSQSKFFLAIFFFATITILLDPKKISIDAFLAKKTSINEVARIFSVQSGNSYLARCTKGADVVARFDVVGFRPNTASNNIWRMGLVLDTYTLNEEYWLRIITDPALETDGFGHEEAATLSLGAVHLLGGPDRLPAVDRLVGVVSERSSIERLKFEYAFKTPVQEGDLLEVDSFGTKILYQVVEGITNTETLDSKDEAGVILGEALQLGIWNAERRCFERFGWVPNMNTPVFLAQRIVSPDPDSSEFQIGSIPGTNFPVFMNREAAVTHHLAVLGVTGSGKSVFSRNLVREIAKDGTKIICVDFTNEYGFRLSDLIDGPLISGDIAENLFSAVDAIGTELDKFPNQRLRNVIDDSENVLREGFGAALRDFISSEANATLFELPDVTNSTGILEYTRWFFRSLFDLAKAKELGGNRVCVVLEEAHTIVPEWNFLGIDDKRSGSVVNSIAQIALQGRKYGVGFIVIAQRTANVSKTVLTQCNSVVAFQQFDRTSSDFLGNYMGEGFVSSLTRLKPRHAIAVGKAFSGGTPMIFSVPQITEPEA